MRLSLTTGSRAEPEERLLDRQCTEKDFFRVFIDGKKHLFASADEYCKWAGRRTLVFPLAPKLAESVSAACLDALLEHSDDSDASEVSDLSSDWEGDCGLIIGATKMTKMSGSNWQIQQQNN